MSDAAYLDTSYKWTDKALSTTTLWAGLAPYMGGQRRNLECKEKGNGMHLPPGRETCRLHKWWEELCNPTTNLDHCGTEDPGLPSSGCGLASVGLIGLAARRR